MKEFWNERFGQDEYIYGELPNEYLKDKLSEISKGKILSAAEGEGRNAVYAAQLGFDSYAFDLSEEGKVKAMKLADKKGVAIEYQLADMDNVSYSTEEFDALVLVFAHFSLANRKEYHQKLASFLKKGGKLVIEGFSKEHQKFQQENPTAGGPRNSEMLYDLEELKSDFEGFNFIEAYKTETSLSEGNHHKGISSVIRILAEKK